MYTIRNFTDNNDIKTLEQRGAFTVVEYLRDLSVTPFDAQIAYFCNEMNVRKRQVICDLSVSDVTTQAGAMQWTVGDVNATTGLKGVGDFFGKALRGSVTGESAIKPEYTGSGTLVLEPTYKHIILVDVADWNGSIVLDDGLFLACESSLKHKA
ncbi:MAG: AIM24 family protein, partial [Clostridia bacterium]|nr:AIM24 family protein [Clostridia bacterium]